MKECKDIESSLPLYLEGVLPAAEKQAVEEHLTDCVQCRKELLYLQKAGQLVEHLSPVEEPPWFQQKIMARVREEAGRKSFVQKWFYPLRIKIPIQIMATLVIAVLAVYIYKSGDEQVKEILPGVQKPTIEMKKEPAPPAMPESGDMAKPTVPREKAALREEVAKDKQVMGNLAAGRSVQKSAAKESKPAAVYEADAHGAKGLAKSKDEVSPVLQTKQNEVASAAEKFADQERKEDRAVAGGAKKKEAYKMAAPAAPRAMAASGAASPQASVVVQVDNLSAAVTEVEKILATYEAKIKSKQVLEGRVVVQAEVSGKYWKDVLLKLKGIGRVEEKAMPADVGQRDMEMLILIILL